MKKRILLVLLALVILVTCAFVSCKKNKGDGGSTNTNTDTSTDTGTVECTHNWGEGEITTAPTCRDNGQKTFTCSLCSETKTEIIASSRDYCNYGDTPVTVEPDCKTETDGEIKYVCSVCGKTDPNRPVDKIDWEHDVADAPITKEPTCDEPGYSVTYCEKCFDREKFETEMSMVGVIEYTTLKALGHDWETISSDPASCAGPEILHQECQNEGCGETQDIQGEPALEHDYEGQPEKIKQPTCTDDGYKYKECKNCGAEEITGMDDSLRTQGHTFDYDNPEFTIVVPATCITDGSITPKCTVEGCGYVGSIDVPGEVVVINATGIHYTTYDESEEFAATCHRNAYTVWTCTADAECGITKEVERENSKLEHELEFVRTIEPRCDAYGYDLWVCKNCPEENAEVCTEVGCVEERNKVYIDHRFTTVLAETYVDSTCITPATVEYICGDCNGQYQYVYPTEEAENLPEVGGKTVVPFKEHIRDEEHAANWIRTEDVVAPTCTEEGYTPYNCIFSGGECGETYNREITMRAQHAFTYHKDGRLVCAECGITYRDITTYNSTPIASSEDTGKGPLTFTDENGETVSLDWEVIGYGAPAAATAVTAGTPVSVTEFKLPMAQGVIELKLADGMNATITVNETAYTVTATYNENGYYNVIITRGNVKSELTIYGTHVYVDLYANTEAVTSITVETSADTEFSLYAKQ